MSAANNTNGFTLQDLVSQLHGLLDIRPDGPTQEQIREACDVLYACSLLKEEGRPVRARVIIAPPDAFAATEGPPDGTHAVRFTTPHNLTSNEIKRLSPAASFFHSVVAIWPDRDRGFRIWGILNTGPRWLNLVAGGRKPLGNEIPHPIIHVRDPGWLLFYNGYNLLAEWRGREFHGPRMDVFQSRLLNERFAAHRLRLVEDLMEGCLPTTLATEAYADLAHLISLQFVKRVINLVRTSGHGGSMVILPDNPEGLEAATQWIDCKYSATPDVAGLRFRSLLQSIIRRVGMLCPEDSTVEDAWHVFRNNSDPELDRLEEAFFELARLFSDLMQVDGALVLDKKLGLIGFGGEIRVDRNVLQVGHAHDLEGTNITPWNVQSDGTRHRSVYRLCSVEPEVIGFVISQDSHVRMIANVDDSVIFWPHTMI
ncbi:MAG: putative sensor domain DACNV-containing protein [Luteolibacter sp.]|uniref:putative sensor domain DACNV-containing protein n=1 Tax=Luteolibacter sp. TaxID=1962973 RepID=UPI0032673E7B